MSDSTNQDVVEETKQGMLFLFDVVNSSTIASKEEQLRNRIFYKKITLITESVINEINNKYKSETFKIQSTGDGYYLFSEEVEIAIHLWILLVRQFLNDGLNIRCGAGYGNVQIHGDNTGSHLGNVVARCCGFSDNASELIITDLLYNLVKDNSYYRSIAPKVEEIDNPNLKGCGDITKIYRLKSINKTNTQLNKTNKSFFGRDAVLSECTQVASECFSCNQALVIRGVSGVGKTTLAISAAAELGLRPICVDLRQVFFLRDLHRVIVDSIYKDLSAYNLTDKVIYSGESTLSDIFSRISSITLVFDHAELLQDKPLRYSEILDYFFTLHNLHVNIILTSTHNLSISSLTVKYWPLRKPTDDEKIDMLSHWIKTKRTWLESLAARIANHSYLICLVGQQYQGLYKSKRGIENIERSIEGTSSVKTYLNHILKNLPENIRFWTYLAYLCNGSIYSKAMPESTFEEYSDRGLVKLIGETAVFHPLVMKAVDAEQDTLNFRQISYTMLGQINDEKSSTLIEYYKYLCLENENINSRKQAVISNWQTWSEEIDSYKVQAIIEQLKQDLDNDKDAITFDLFASIIHIFQGKRENLDMAYQMCNKIAEDNSITSCIRLLAQLECIESQRKIKGPSVAVSLIYDNMQSINEKITEIQSSTYNYYGKYYCLGTVYFLIGNILRSLEDHDNAILAYKKSLIYINKEDLSIRNAALQKVHISYGIAESYLKKGQFLFAVEYANEIIRQNSSMAKFGLALFQLLEARAYLCADFSTDDNFKKALECENHAYKLFSDIRLPNYIQRCKFVEAAIYAKKKQKKTSRRKLVEMMEHLPGNDDMSYRVEVLLNKILGIKGEITPEKINVITQRKGRQIGLFFKNACDVEYNVPINQQIDTIKIEDNLLVKGTFSSTVQDIKNIWLVD